RHAAAEGALVGRLDGGTVGHRVGERHADLDHVGAGSGQAAQDRERGLAVRIAGTDIGDEAGAAGLPERREAPLQPSLTRAHAPISIPSALATLGTSLSPRPHMFITIR